MKQSPLADRHLALNAKMADFGGWLMPIEYPKLVQLLSTHQFANRLASLMFHI